MVSGEEESIMADMTKQEVERLGELMKQRNQELRNEIRAELLKADDEQFRDVAGSVGDMADEALADAVVDMDAAIVGRHIREIRDIEAAQKRIADGSYGVCIDCGEAIGYERLLAYPTAKRCIRCQEQREKQFSHENTPTM
jgi:DnaK suppressor protein